MVDGRGAESWWDAGGMRFSPGRAPVQAQSGPFGGSVAVVEKSSWYAELGQQRPLQVRVRRSRSWQATESQGPAPHVQRLALDWWSTKDGSIAHVSACRILMG